MNASPSLTLPRIVDSRVGEFRFDEASHTYWLGDKPLPGITGIIRACRYSDARWYTDEARTRGSHVHLAIRYLNKGTLDWSSVLDAYLGYVLAYQRFARDWQLRLTSFEEPMFHPDLLYAGTPDLVGTVFGGVPAIVELKTGPVLPWVALQTIAQEMLARAWDTAPVRRRRWGVTLNADGTYSKPHEFRDAERDEAVFRMLNAAVQAVGKDAAPDLFDALLKLTPAARLAVAAPLFNSVVEHRELYAA